MNRQGVGCRADKVLHPTALHTRLKTVVFELSVYFDDRSVGAAINTSQGYLNRETAACRTVWARPGDFEFAKLCLLLIITIAKIKLHPKC